MKPKAQSYKTQAMTQDIMSKTVSNKNNQLGVGFGGEAPTTMSKLASPIKAKTNALAKAKLK